MPLWTYSKYRYLLFGIKILTLNLIEPKYYWKYKNKSAAVFFAISVRLVLCRTVIISTRRRYRIDGDNWILLLCQCKPQFLWRRSNLDSRVVAIICTYDLHYVRRPLCIFFIHVNVYRKCYHLPAHCWTPTICFC